MRYFGDTHVRANSFAQGVHPKVVQEMLGHSTIVMAMDLNSHATRSLQEAAATKLDAALQSAGRGFGGGRVGGRDLNVTTRVPVQGALETPTK